MSILTQENEIRILAIFKKFNLDASISVKRISNGLITCKKQKMLLWIFALSISNVISSNDDVIIRKIIKYIIFLKVLSSPKWMIKKVINNNKMHEIHMNKIVEKKLWELFFIDLFPARFFITVKFKPRVTKGIKPETIQIIWT